MKNIIVKVGYERLINIKNYENIKVKIGMEATVDAKDGSSEDVYESISIFCKEKLNKEVSRIEDLFNSGKSKEDITC